MIINNDCLIALKELPENSVDAIVTDPPYGLSFMGKKWDYDVPSTEIWQECLRVLKPGGYLLAFAGTRTYHRMACAIEDAGFEVRDMIEWVYGSGFPKSLNIGKAVDKLQGNEREVLGEKETKDFSHHKGSMMGKETTPDDKTQTTTITETKGTSEWEGWGTALKPAHEPICMARKPLAEKTVAENVLKYGTGGINIDDSRVETSDKYSYPNGAGGNSFSVGEEPDGKRTEPVESNSLGRFPANLIHDNSEEVRECFPETKQPSFRNGDRVSNNNGIVPWNKGRESGREVKGAGFTDTGNASRFFKSIIYQAKASKSERNKGCEEIDAQIRVRQGLAGEKKDTLSSNFHPTVKPIALMEYLIKMVTPKGGIVLDPFTGSGTTGIACKNLNRNFIGIERDEEYCKIAEARINA